MEPHNIKISSRLQQFSGCLSKEISKQKIASQAAWFEGKHGGVLQVFSKKDGKKLAEKKLDRLPAFDGMVAASGKLYMTTECGSILCYK